MFDSRTEPVFILRTGLVTLGILVLVPMKGAEPNGCLVVSPKVR